MSEVRPLLMFITSHAAAAATAAAAAAAAAHLSRLLHLHRQMSAKKASIFEMLPILDYR